MAGAGIHRCRAGRDASRTRVCLYWDDEAHARESTPRRHKLARISYDDQTAEAYKTVREIPREGLTEWRQAVRRHLGPPAGMTVVDIGAGTGVFATAFSDWFGLSVLAVEPSAAMRAKIPARPGIQIFEGHASTLPLPGRSADGAWMSLMIR